MGPQPADSDRSGRDGAAARRHQFYWRTHLRLHVPVVTTPDVKFTVAGNTVHMAAGECWVFDTFSMHRVENGGANKRTHLVPDTVGGESRALIESVPGLHPAQRGWDSNRLAAEDATPERAELLAARFHAALRDRGGKPPSARVVMLEKTPKNSLRVPFLARVIPDARFLYLYRDPRETLSSMLEAWESGRFVAYPRLPGWTPRAWSLLLIPGWRELIGAPLERVVARQWAVTTRVLLDDLTALPGERVRTVSYERFLAAPQATARAVCDAFALGWDRDLSNALPLSPTVVSAPAPEK